MNHLVLKDLLVGVRMKSLVGRMIGLVGHMIDSGVGLVVVHTIDLGVGLVEVRRTSLVGRKIDLEVDLVEVHTKRKVEVHKQA